MTDKYDDLAHDLAKKTQYRPPYAAEKILSSALRAVAHEQMQALPGEIANLLTDACQILDVVKREWGKSWSSWDQSVRDRITTVLSAMIEEKPHE